ncbi:hypothetical protein HZF08_02635 [Paenibacillus sp. CGMCC 1.16610]|uniref:Serine aminopeptidase S33 domain-containing protein n=1 Tax=Paenibacillus anseongense TaxID=2682845 RepID=A0ABW9U842_9BACL|nr:MULTISPECIES: hypothetical protein [Paenibacillus]MBA2937188.1 hypothetical protein [Paenibacillus sp. CGMCC 1.16610]MVQ36249.1 hypothetical protein [Paenibacillus anseongense]
MEQIEYRDICGVPCIILDPSSEQVGQIVLYHGWGSTIESYKFFASLISSWGYRVTIPELPCHGVRGSLNYFDKETLQKKFWPGRHFQLVEYPRVNHQITLGMLQKIKEFLDKNLLSL